MAAPKSKLNIGGSKAYLARRRKKRERHARISGDPKKLYEMYYEDEGDDPSFITGTRQKIENEQARRKGKKKPHLGRTVKEAAEERRKYREDLYFGEKKKAKDQAKGLD